MPSFSPVPFCLRSSTSLLRAEEPRSSRLVAEVFIGLFRGDGLSFLN